jgi:ribosomal protein S18 acetylase RimI-like enzyme
MVIRRATEADALADVYRRSSLSNEGDRPHLLDHPEALVWDTTLIRKGGTILAEVDGRIVGFATTSDHDGTAELVDLFTDPDWMRRGVASALLRECADESRQRRVRRIDVTANAHALAFYESAGFVRDHTVPTLFGPGHRMHLDVSDS